MQALVFGNYAILPGELRYYYLNSGDVSDLRIFLAMSLKPSVEVFLRNLWENWDNCKDKAIKEAHYSALISAIRVLLIDNMPCRVGGNT